VTLNLEKTRGASKLGSQPAYSTLASARVGALAGGLAMLGHWRPLFLGFQKGGKTVATAGGTFFGIATVLGLIGLGIWILVFLVARYASLASIVTALSLPFVGLALGEPWPVIVFAAAAAVAVVLLHKVNIRRLRAGTESRFRLRRA
jgi:glycerol-3-phosphate acyltransferase PlsY